MLQPGETLFNNKYRIERLLGEGAYSKVYLAYDLEINNPRAIKVLRREIPGLSSQEYQVYKKRFQEEASLGDRYNHPNLVRVYGFHEEDGMLGLVMEYCKGGSLRDLLREKKKEKSSFSSEEVLGIGRDIADGLAEIHRDEIVHRDLKPENILLDQKGRAKVADLGLAQVPGGPTLRGIKSDALPHPGTPGYRSPEHEESKNLLPYAADVYQLGLVLFELLTGRVYQLEKPGTRARELRTETPEWLDELLVRMLQADPQVRPWDGSEASELLRTGEAAEKAQRAQQVAVERERQARAEREEKERKEAEQKAKRDADEKARRAATERQHREANAPEPSHGVRQPAKGDQEKASDAGTRKEFGAEKAKKRILPWLSDGVGLLGLGAGLIVVVFILIKALGVGGAGNEITPVAQNPLDTEQVTIAETPVLNQPVIEVATNIPTPSSTVSEKDGMVMVYVPEGEFQMGAEDGRDDEMPAHTVYLDAFWIDQTEVTNGMYSLCVQAGVCDPPNGEGSYSRGAYHGEVQYADYPVINVDWYDAMAYCEWAGRRLPLEAEWEKAARGMDGRVYPWGNASPSNSLLNYNANIGDTTEVGSYPDGASPYGALDMAGNVWEWVADWYDEDYYSNSPASNPLGPSNGDYRALRGGSWLNNEVVVRSACRIGDEPDFWDSLFGFRCALSP